MNLKSQLPVYYDDTHGWIVLSDETLPPYMLLSIRDYVYKVNSQRLKDMRGDKRERTQFALDRLLKEGVRIMTQNSSIDLFKSTERSTSKSYHFFGGKNNG